MYWIVVFVMAFAAMGFLAWPLLRAERRRSTRATVLWVLALVVPALAVGAASFLREEPSRVTTSSSGLDSIAWPGESTVTQPVAEEPATSVAPVSSLVTGLRARLDENPEDVGGWALLAQSYAFMADGPGAEGAIARAVELGFDEGELRNRVELAFQSSRTPAESAIPTAAPGTSPDWLERDIGG